MKRRENRVERRTNRSWGRLGNEQLGKRHFETARINHTFVVLDIDIL
jgi:hypothetical protein